MQIELPKFRICKDRKGLAFAVFESVDDMLTFDLMLTHYFEMCDIGKFDVEKQEEVTCSEEDVNAFFLGYLH